VIQLWNSIANKKQNRHIRLSKLKKKCTFVASLKKSSFKNGRIKKYFHILFTFTFPFLTFVAGLKTAIFCVTNLPTDENSK